jgi:hypothetical protein
MKTGRNEPCPCGSGKKYKRCCLGKAEPAQNASPTVPQGIEDIDLESPEKWIKMLHNMQYLMLRSKPHIKAYKKIRKLYEEICDAMVAYYDSGRFEHCFAPVPQEAYKNKEDAKKLRLIESEFDLNTDLGGHAFYNMIIFKASPNANCITEDFINSNRYRKPEKVEMLQSMLDSASGLFEIIETDANQSYAHIREVFTGNEYELTDIGLSGNPNCERFYIYDRIITYQDVSFGTGLGILFEKTDPFIQSFIKKHQDDYKPFGEYTRFTELYNRFSKDSNGVKVARNSV